MEMSWSSSHNGSAAMEGYRLFGKDGLGRQGREVILSVKQQLGSKELCSGKVGGASSELVGQDPTWVML